MMASHNGMAQLLITYQNHDVCVDEGERYQLAWLMPLLTIQALKSPGGCR